MVPRIRITTAKIGIAPGSIVYTGQQHVEEVRLDVTRYGPDDHEEYTLGIDSLEDFETPSPGDPGVLWLNVAGLHDVEIIQRIGARFGVHSLALEDAVAVNLRPGFTSFDDHVFMTLKMLQTGPDGGVEVEHLSLVSGPGWVISFQERPGDVFEHVRRRIRESTKRIRKRGSDYLWYALLDAVADHYLLVLNDVAGRLDSIETAVWEETEEASIPKLIQACRHDIMTIRKAVRPLRDAVDELNGSPPEFMAEDTIPFLGDLWDHTTQMTDTVEQMREVLSSVMDAHISRVSMRTNEVMKVLTIMASVFIPLTFIAGIYGMNFEYMPELGVRWAYPMVWAVMLSAGGGMMIYFWRKKWL